MTIAGRKEHMEIRVYDNAAQAGQAAAALFAAQLTRKPDSVLGLATGSTPIPTYKQLIYLYQQGAVDFSRAVSYNLDEYVGLAPEHPCSYHAFMMEQLCAVTGREDLYEENVTQVGQQIEEAQANAALSSTRPNVLLIRAFSTGIKAKTDDELAGAILKDLGAHNIADDHPSMLEDLSLEEVIAADPDYIFVTTMGDEQKALDYLNGLIQQNPAWSELSAVKEDRYIVLPKDLFHYKPNNRWGESYQYLGEILYPQLFHEE